MSKNIEKYLFLKKFIDNQKEGNSFYSVTEEEILSSESLLGFEFPSELKEFYREIGYGFLSEQHDYKKLNLSLTNRINPPDLIVEMLLEGEDSGLIDTMTLEFLDDGEIPFFEIGDSCRFLIMKTKSENPNAVWTPTGIKIEDSFEKFIWRLYYEDPAYYDDIIEAHYAKKS